jgi:hypothetical protein
MQRFALPLLLSCALAAPALADGERPLLGDPVNGAKLYKKASGDASPRVDGAWINKYGDSQAMTGLAKGKAGFPKVKGDNALDRWDVLAFLRGANANVLDLMPGSTHMLLSKAELDQYALERLTDQARIKVPDDMKKGHVYVFFTTGEAKGDIRRVREKNARVRDELKPKSKSGYVVFMPLPGVRKGGHEVAFGINPDMQITTIEVRGPNGEAPADLNQAAKRYVGKGARGKYDAIKAPGAGRAMSELKKPLSEAFLLAAERIYMYEVKEREYFAFDE